MSTYVFEDIGERPYQEDRHIVDEFTLPGFRFFAIFDGHGGDKVSNFLKIHFKNILFGLLNKKTLYSVTECTNCLYKTFEIVNSILPRHISMFCGSTAIVVLQHQNYIHVANIGDSRAIMNEYNTPISLSKDHKPEDIEEHTRIVNSNGFVTKDGFGTCRVNGTLAMSRAVGDFYLVPYISNIPDVRSFIIDPAINNYIIMASDGIWDTISNQEVINFVYDYLIEDNYTFKPKQHIALCRNIFALCRIRGSTDNATFILINTRVM